MDLDLGARKSHSTKQTKKVVIQSISVKIFLWTRALAWLLSKFQKVKGKDTKWILMLLEKEWKDLKKVLKKIN